MLYLLTDMESTACGVRIGADKASDFGPYDHVTRGTCSSGTESKPHRMALPLESAEYAEPESRPDSESE